MREPEGERERERGNEISQDFVVTSTDYEATEESSKDSRCHDLSGLVFSWS